MSKQALLAAMSTIISVLVITKFSDSVWTGLALYALFSVVRIVGSEK